MTAQAVNDEQKWQLSAKMRLVHERAGKSLSYEALMDALQEIINTGGVSSQSFLLMATNPKEWVIPGFESDTPVSTQKLLEDSPYLAIDTSFREYILNGQISSVTNLPGEVWGHRDIAADTSPKVLLNELSEKCLFEESRSSFCVYLQVSFDPDCIKWQKERLKAPPWIRSAQNMFFVRGRFGKIYLVNITLEDNRWYLHAQDVEQTKSRVSISKGSRIFYPGQ